MLQNKKVASKNPFNKAKPTLVLSLVLLAGVSAILFGLTRGNSNVSTNKVVTFSTNDPSEQKPGRGYRWQGGPKDPKKIAIPSIGVNGYIQNVGIDQNKAVAVPNNIHIAGWFTQSVLPGEKGLSIVDGHVDGKTQDGIFKDLAKIKPGAQLQIEFGSGTKKAFKVVKVEEAIEDKAASVLFSQSPETTNQLNLITCSGDFNKSTKRYEKRVIVSTELVPAS